MCQSDMVAKKWLHEKQKAKHVMFLPMSISTPIYNCLPLDVRLGMTDTLIWTKNN